MHYRIPGPVQGIQGGSITMALEVQNLGVTVDSDTRLINFNSSILTATQIAAGDVLVEAVIPSGATSPVGAVTPSKADEPYNQIASDRVVRWVSTGTANTDWIAIGGSAIQQTYNPNEAPAFPGQEWQYVSIPSTGVITINFIWRGVNINGAADTSSWARIY